MTTPMPQVPVNLNPAQAVPPRPAAPITTRALKHEATKGTERVWFNLPNHLKSLVNKYVAEPANEFQGAPGNFYVLAVARLLQDMAPFFRHDAEYTATIRALERLSRRLEYEEPMAEFQRHLEEAEKAATICVDVHNWAFGLVILREAVGAIMSAPDEMREVWEIQLRASRPMKALMQALVHDEAYGMSSEVDRLQKWMGGAL